MKDNREPAISVTLGYEGGYTNNPKDPGGPTNWGITITDARKYWKTDATALDVRNMPKSVAIDIYRQRYWAPLDCDSDPAGVDLVTFDYGVNSGLGRARPVRAKTKTADAVAWVKSICAERLSFLHRLKTWSTFGGGWGKRVADVEARGVKMALQAQLPGKPQEQHETLRKESTAAKKSSTVAATKGTATTAGTAVSQSGTDIFHQIPHSVIVFGAIVGIIAVSYFFYWAVQHSNRAKAYAAVAKE